MVRRFPALLIGLLSLLATALGQSPAPSSDPIAGKLEEAKKAYKQEVEKLSTASIINAFDRADEMARDDADVGLVKSIKAERAVFEATGKPPRRFRETEYAKQREVIRKAMFDAYTLAIRDYLKARKDDEAEKIKEVRDEFQRDKSVVVPVKVDANSKFEFGVARFGVGSEQVNDADLDLHVIEPGGKEIFWNDRKGKAGGELLDVDNVEGFGPENIAWPTDSNPAPPGEYKWFVQYYGGNRGVPVATRPEFPTGF
jgi:hypothetical protein